MAKQNISRILDALLTLLEEDKKLPLDDPQKMKKKERLEIINKMERLQLSRGRQRVETAPLVVLEKHTRRPGQLKTSRISHGLGHLTEPEKTVAAEPKADEFLKRIGAVNG